MKDQPEARTPITFRSTKEAIGCTVLAVVVGLVPGSAIAANVAMWIAHRQRDAYLRGEPMPATEPLWFLFWATLGFFPLLAVGWVTVQYGGQYRFLILSVGWGLILGVLTFLAFGPRV